MAAETRTAYDVAADLVEGEAEADLRAAASRAYMAGFQHLLRHADGLGFTPENTGRDHGRLKGYLLNSGDPTLEAIGYELDKLRHTRNGADYHIWAPFPEPHARYAVERAHAIIHHLYPAGE